MRRAHYLKGNKTGAMPERVVIFDTETREYKRDGDTVHHRLWFGWLCSTRRRDGQHWSVPKWERFTSGEEVYEALVSFGDSHHVVTAYSHNIGFDVAALDLLRVFQDHGWTLTQAVLEVPPCWFVFKRGRQSIKLIDTINFFPMSLKALGKSVGMDKLDMPSLEGGSDKWDRYCKRDVEVLLRSVQAWFSRLSSWDLGTCGPSLPSQAFRAFRHRFMPHKILIDNHPLALDTARKGYYGGRVECFWLGEHYGWVDKLDINSMYPYVMRKHLYPTVLRTVWTRVSTDALRKVLEDHCVCARVRIRTDEPAYPVRTTARLLFPVGEFETYLCTPELLYGLDRGHIVGCSIAAIYDRANIFVDYVDFFFQKRIEAKAANDTAGDLMCKLFLNSLYGKFGQKGRMYHNVQTDAREDYKVWYEIDAETRQRYFYRQVGNLVQTITGETEGTDSHPAIAAHVTAYARVYLWQLICVAGLSDVFYCDTDSLICTPLGTERLADYLDPSLLGMLKREGQALVLRIYGPKDYLFGDERKAKGIRKDAEWFDSSTLKQLHFDSIRTLLYKGDVSHPQMRYVTKHIDRTYKKGHYLAPCRTAPYVLPDDTIPD